MPRRSLKSIANMVAAMKFGRNATNIANAKNAKIGLNNPGFKDAHKPSAYSASQEYTDLYTLGPIIDDILDAIHALEDESAGIGEYLHDHFGSEEDKIQIPADLRVEIGGAFVQALYENSDNIIIGADVFLPNSGVVNFQITGNNTLQVGGVPIINASGEWIGPSTGLKGQKGQRGVAGTSGTDGTSGSSGSSGSSGTDGSSGTNGTNGSSGTDGSSGTN